MKKIISMCFALLLGASIYALAQIQKSETAEMANIIPSERFVATESVQKCPIQHTPQRVAATQQTELVDVFSEVENFSWYGNATTSLSDNSCSISIPAGEFDYILFIPLNLDFLKGETTISFDLTSDGNCVLTPAAIEYPKDSGTTYYTAFNDVDVDLAGESTVTITDVSFSYSGNSSRTSANYYHGFWIAINASNDVNLTLSNISMEQERTIAATVGSECPYTFDNSNAYLQLDETSWMAFYVYNSSNAYVTGLYTNDDNAILPDKIKYPEQYGDLEIPVTGIGYLGNSFDWSKCPNVKHMTFSNASTFNINTYFNNSAITDIYFQGGKYYNYNSRFRTDDKRTNVHIPVGYKSNFSGYGFWSNCEILVGDETPGMPTMNYSEYRVNVGENEYLGLSVVDSKIAVSEIYTESESFVIPNYIPYGSSENLYYINYVGRGSSSTYYNALFAQASNVKSLTLPSRVTNLYINFSYSPITELHFAGYAPSSSYWSIPASIPLYVMDQNYYGTFATNYPNHSINPDGWDFEWLTLDVQKPGEFAQTYLDATNNNWATGLYVKINGPLNSIDLNNIKNLTSLIKLDISGTEITSLPSNFLQDKEILREVILPSTLLTINSNAFDGCKQLLSVTVNGDNNITTINENAFRNCTKLNVFDASKANTIGQYAFYYCSSLNLASIESATSIGSNAFAYSGIKKIEPGFFANSISTLPSYAFYNCKSLQSIELQDNITNIGNDCFRECSALNSLKLSKYLFTIGSSAFYRTPITTLDLPDRLRMIGYDAFTYCTSLTKVISRSVAPPMATDAFMRNVDYTYIDLFVPPISLDAYRAASYWSSFYKMRELIEPIDYIYIDRPVAINLSETDNELVSQKPRMTLVDYYLNSNYSSAYIGQLTIEGEGTLSASVIDIYPKLDYRDWGKNVQWNRPSIINNADKMRTDSLSVHMEMYGDRWHFITLPYDVQVRDIVPSPNTYWVIRRYDGAKRAMGELGTTWVDLSNDDVMEAGKGYIVRAYNDNYDEWGYNETYPMLTFPSRNTTTKNNIFRSTDVIVELDEHISEFAHNRSWNLVGNPYPAYVYTPNLQNQNGEQLTTPITIWRGSSYQAYSPIDDDLILRPYESFFIQRPLDSESIIFPKESRYHFNAAYNASSSGHGMFAPARLDHENNSSDFIREVFDFTISSSDVLDNRARIVFNEKATLGYDIDFDAVKFFTVENDNPLIYVNAGQRYDINERPYDDGNAILGIQLFADGEYKISLGGKHNSDWKIWLTDTFTGTVINLMENDYIFDGKQSSDPMRFSIRFEKPNASGIDNIEFIRDDALISVSTLDGMVIYNGVKSGFDAPASGIYLVTFNGKTVKIVVQK